MRVHAFRLTPGADLEVELAPVTQSAADLVRSIKDDGPT